MHSNDSYQLHHIYNTTRNFKKMMFLVAHQQTTQFIIHRLQEPPYHLTVAMEEPNKLTRTIPKGERLIFPTQRWKTRKRKKRKKDHVQNSSHPNLEMTPICLGGVLRDCGPHTSLISGGWTRS